METFKQLNDYSTGTNSFKLYKKHNFLKFFEIVLVIFVLVAILYMIYAGKFNGIVSSFFNATINNQYDNQFAMNPNVTTTVPITNNVRTENFNNYTIINYNNYTINVGACKCNCS